MNWLGIVPPTMVSMKREVVRRVVVALSTRIFSNFDLVGELLEELLLAV